MIDFAMVSTLGLLLIKIHSKLTQLYVTEVNLPSYIRY